MKMQDKIPLSILVCTRNEALNLPRALASLQEFDEVVVVDSQSTDKTCDIAQAFGARLVRFFWDGTYPKKRQWCLEKLTLRHERILFFDADEELTPALVEEIRRLEWRCAGYFIKGRYVISGKTLRFGTTNNKLVLFDRRKFVFPQVDDLDIPGMGEIEGHYQPVLRPAYADEKIGRLKAPLLHYAFDQPDRWVQRHQNYAGWEAEMIRRNAYPRDPLVWREGLKRLFRAMPARGQASFLLSYILCLGVCDGRAGYHFARRKMGYYALCGRLKKERPRRRA